jgi:O-acetyl-ADP-ribose deacetylase (regulator of RNase III)
MLHVCDGDLLQSDCTVIIHQANCFSSMEGGIAKQIKRLYPEAYDADMQDPRSPEERLGSFSYAVIRRDLRLIVNLYGQYRYQGTAGEVLTDYGALEKGLRACLNQLDKIREKEGLHRVPEKIGLPFGIGCGLGGGDWETVRRILAMVSRDTGKPLYLYRLR